MDVDCSPAVVFPEGQATQASCWIPSLYVPRAHGTHVAGLCQPELLVAAQPAAVGECTSEMWVGLAQHNIAQQLDSAYCTAGWM